MMITQTFKIIFTCDKCGDAQSQYFSVAPSALVPIGVLPNNWVAVTRNDITNHICAECWKKLK